MYLVKASTLSLMFINTRLVNTLGTHSKVRTTKCQLAQFHVAIIPIFLILPNHAQQHDQFFGLVKYGKGRFGDDFVDVVQLEDPITNLIGVC